MRFINDDKGMTLTELLVVCVLASMILAASFFLFAAAQAMNNDATARAYAADESQAALDKMSLELRQGEENGVNNGVFTVASPNEVAFFSDINRDGRAELIHYYVEGGALKRTMAAATSAAPPWTHAAPGAPTTLIPELQNGTTSDPVFCYHNMSSSTTATCGTTTYRDNHHGFGVVTAADPSISMVGITVVARGTSGDANVDVTTFQLVRVRAVQNKVN